MNITASPLFKRQLKKLKNKGYPTEVLTFCVNAIINQDSPVLIRIKDHALKGSWKGYREFHPGRYKNDASSNDGWIVIYRINQNEFTLTLAATGNHEILNR